MTDLRNFKVTVVEDRESDICVPFGENLRIHVENTEEKGKDDDENDDDLFTAVMSNATPTIEDEKERVKADILNLKSQNNMSYVENIKIHAEQIGEKEQEMVNRHILSEEDVFTKESKEHKTHVKSFVTYHTKHIPSHTQSRSHSPGQRYSTRRRSSRQSDDPERVTTDYPGQKYRKRTYSLRKDPARKSHSPEQRYLTKSYSSRENQTRRSDSRGYIQTDRSWSPEQKRLRTSLSQTERQSGRNISRNSSSPHKHGHSSDRNRSPRRSPSHRSYSKRREESDRLNTELLHPIYKALQDHFTVRGYGDIFGVERNLFFIEHKMPETSQGDTHSYCNEHEAEYIVQLYEYLMKQGYQSEQITILTTYTGQMFSIRRKIQQASKYPDVMVTVVDNYQGEENDIILLSLVRSNQNDTIGFIRMENRICVALSRAKRGLFVIGNITMLAKKCNIWKTIWSILKRQNNIGQHLPLYCQNHLSHKIAAANTSDFDRAPDGGCMEKCRFRLACGHVCAKYCHIIDSMHYDYKCRKPCTQTIKKCGHRCLRMCCEDCNHCITLVSKILPRCNHEIEIECHKDKWSVDCPKPCEQQLPCGHHCQNRCGKQCTDKCYEKVEKVWLLCEHKKMDNCYINPDVVPCPERCETVLDCGHKCTGRCGRCLNGRLHKACVENCSKILICGHKCRGRCNQPCPPCQLQCQTKCPHSECQNLCGDRCTPCMEPCQWRCPHHTCTLPCGLPCNRPPCNEPCRKLLNCGHPCIGICGEPCPTLCRICHRDVVTDIFFGTEEDKDARFVQLQDCTHCLEVTGLDQWMGINENNEGNTAIQYKKCPKCSSLIQKSMRYNRQMNDILQDLNRLKGLKSYEHSDMKIKLQQMVEKIADIDELIGKRYRRKIDDAKTIHEIQFYINICTCIQTVLEVKNTWNQNKQIIESAGKSGLAVKLIENDLKNMEKWCQQKGKYDVSNQQMDEASLEVARIELQFKYLLMFLSGQIYHSEHKEALDKSFKMIHDLNGKNKLTEEKRELFCSEFEKLLEILPKPGLKISDEEKKQIVKAVGLSQGHWYKCPSGHIYAIGECGGAMETSTCPECGVEIGGQRHRLADGNVHTPEMDGSAYAAWSEQANMENYHF